MEKHFLDGEVEGTPGFRKEFWYNPHGDCLELYTENVAVVADRIDDIITIFRAADTDAPVGCQIKGISALLKLLDATHVRVEAGEAQNVVRHVKVEFAVLAALRKALMSPTAMRHLDRYAELVGILGAFARGQEFAVPERESPEAGVSLAGT